MTQLIEVFLLAGGNTSVAKDWTVVSDLQGISDLNLSVNLNDSDKLTFSMNGLHPDAKLVHELLSDVLVRRNGINLFRGRVGPSSDSLDGSKHSVSYTCFSYREVLKRRLIYATDTVLTYAQTTLRDLEDIGWNLITTTQTRSGRSGNLGITRAGISTGLKVNKVFEAGQEIGSLLDQLTDDDPGMEWEIDPNLVYRTYYPLRGNQTDEHLLDYGGNVSAVDRQVETADYSNVLYASGGAPTGGGSAPAPFVNETSTVIANQAYEGRWETGYANQNAITAAQLTAAANGELLKRGVFAPGYSMSLKPGAWDGPTDLWIGDKCRVVVKSGRLDVDVLSRVLGLTLNIKDGAESVDIQTGQLVDAYYKWTNDRRNILTRLYTLERR